jgi:outer membrane immunogenic protein
MHTKLAFVLAAAMGFGGMQVATAADMAVKARPMAPVPAAFSWTGCFIGGNAGGLWARKDWNTASGDPSGFPVGTAFGSHDPTGFLGGAQVGCDYQFAGSYVIGIQGDYDWSNTKGSSADAVNAAFFGTTPWTDETRVKSLGSVTGRYGYAWDRFLGYARGGVAWERDDYSIFNPAGLTSATAS